MGRFVAVTTGNERNEAVAILRTLGYDATHVGEIGMGRAADSEILAFAVALGDTRPRRVLMPPPAGLRRGLPTSSKGMLAAADASTVRAWKEVASASLGSRMSEVARTALPNFARVGCGFGNG